jgi:hypothetical protein
MYCFLQMEERPQQRRQSATSQGNAADRRVEQLDDVADRQFSPHAPEGRLSCSRQPGLPDTTMSASSAATWARSPVAELHRGFRLHQVVDSRGAAADRGFGDFQQLELRDAFQQHARLRADALRVLQVAGIVVGHAQAQRVASGARPELGQEFGDDAALRRKRLRAPGVLRIVAQQVAVLFHIRAAAPARNEEEIADVLIAERDYERASEFCHSAVKRGELLSAGDPNDTDVHSNLASSYEKLGEALVGKGKPDEALQNFRISLRIFERLLNGRHVGQHQLSDCIPDVLGRCPRWHGRRHGVYLGRFQNLRLSRTRISLPRVLSSMKKTEANPVDLDAANLEVVWESK